MVIGYYVHAVLHVVVSTSPTCVVRVLVLPMRLMGNMVHSMLCDVLAMYVDVQERMLIGTWWGEGKGGLCDSDVVVVPCVLRARGDDNMRLVLHPRVHMVGME